MEIKSKLKSVFYIDEIGVDKKHRMHGVGGKITKSIINQTKKIGINTNAKIRVVFSAPPTQCADKNFISKTEKITKKKSEGANYATDGSFLNDLSSKIIILGPGPFNSHQTDEWVSKKSLYETERVYKEIIENLIK